MITDLVETLEDGREGFRQVSDKLADQGYADVAGRMMEFSDERARFAAELRQFSRETLGEDIEESGSVAAALHRGWISLADAVTGDDPHAILAAAEAGEDHAVSEYDDALADSSLSGELRDIVTRQAGEVRSAHNALRTLRDSFDS
ncbi:MAG TPA: PA2169 family four-helix-bundle protein [Acidimicrobiia bacterium]